ncbi:nucleotidyltransferase family protein [Chryseobacterium gregarium]|uniref:nucleotidyltransferase family protein n=1 Tax=Chryseobacterium gregarium TaxID=456299 RepID=UPI0003F8E598|nr:nucleotidyltransferase family protein [Chryseobacterium gregarium]
MTQENTGIIILAAGNSSRLGQPKQLLDYQGKTLLGHTVEQALAVSSKVIVVTGNENSGIEKETGSAGTIQNEKWQEGMASSIHKGLNEMLLAYPETQNILITVCDQPNINASVFSELIEKRQSSAKGIIASHYSGTLGTPVLFSRSYFSDLFQLNGHEGAKKLLIKYRDDVGQVMFEKGSVDIDTPEDYQKLINNQ